MEIGFEHSPALTVAVALAAGMLAQAAARHLRLPGIVLLLGCGSALRQGDRLLVAVARSGSDELSEWLESNGWSRSALDDPT